MSWCGDNDLGPVVRASTDEQLRARIAKRVVRTVAGCLEWTSTLGDGYGKVVVAWRPSNAPVRRLAHVVLYELEHGPVAEHLDLDHLCRNRKCCEPTHLEPVTRSVNVKRGAMPGLLKARAAAQTHCRDGHPLSGDNLVLQGPEKKFRVCRTCRTRRQRERYHDQKKAS